METIRTIEIKGKMRKQRLCDICNEWTSYSNYTKHLAFKKCMKHRKIDDEVQEVQEVQEVHEYIDEYTEPLEVQEVQEVQEKVQIISPEKQKLLISISKLIVNHPNFDLNDIKEQETITKELYDELARMDIFKLKQILNALKEKEGRGILEDIGESVYDGIIRGLKEARGYDNNFITDCNKETFKKSFFSLSLYIPLEIIQGIQYMIKTPFWSVFGIGLSALKQEFTRPVKEKKEIEKVFEDLCKDDVEISFDEEEKCDVLEDDDIIPEEIKNAFDLANNKF